MCGKLTNKRDSLYTFIQYLCVLIENSTSKLLLLYIYVNMKGDKKRRKTMFSKGHTSCWKGGKIEKTHLKDQSLGKYVRLNQNDFELVAQHTADGGMVFAHDSDGKICDTKLLRPKKNPPSFLDKLCESKGSSFSNDYKIIHPQKMQKMWQEAIRGHSNKNPECAGELELDERGEVRYGVCWQERIKCSDCDYVSERHKLYEEIDTGKRGRKAAVPNIGLQVGLTHTGIGNTGLRTLLQSASIPAPSFTAMQRASYSVNKQIIHENENDMKNRRQKIKEVNEIKGLPSNAPIRVEGDGRFNNPLYAAAGSTPFQPATQVTYTICENVTKNKQIIAVNNQNKLCATGARLVGEDGKPYDCVNENRRHRGHCSATISVGDSIGNEHRWATGCVEQLLSDGIEIKYITTDCDSRASAAVADCYKEKGICTTPTHLKDPQHLSRSQRRKINNTKFSFFMFPGKNKEERQKVQTRFADDICDRCTAEFKSAFEQLNGNLLDIKRALSYVPDAIIKCYQGNHSYCKKYSFVCAGTAKKSWSGTYFPKTCRITCTSNDRRLLRECINHRLGQRTLCDTRFNTSTQKTEAVNRVYSLRNPKNLTWCRNFTGRIHSTVHQINNGPGQSLALQLSAAGAPVAQGSTVARQLRSKQKQYLYVKHYRKQYFVKLRRSIKRANKYRLYDFKKATTKSNYHYKRCLIECKKTDTRGQVRADHTYCK